MEDDGNLLGTCRTLDGADGYDMHSGPLEQGLLSRSGWALVDDSKNHILAPDDSHWKEWVAMRPDGARQDYYISLLMETTTSRHWQIIRKWRARRLCRLNIHSVTGGAAIGNIPTMSSRIW